MREATVEELKRVMDGDGDARLIDVRSPGEYSEVKITGAELMPLTHFDQFALLLDGGQEIYALCRSGRRAAEFCRRLEALGRNAICVVGGIDAWIKHGYPVERGRWSIERQTRFGLGLLVFLGVALALAVHPGFIYLSGFIGLGLMYSGATNFCGFSILLSKMPWNRVGDGSS